MKTTKLNKLSNQEDQLESCIYSIGTAISYTNNTALKCLLKKALTMAEVKLAKTYFKSNGKLKI